MSIEDLYRTAVLDHNRAPRNRGELEGATHSARGLDALCGDDLRVSLIMNDGQIVAISFLGEASAITMASASMMTEALRGLAEGDARTLLKNLEQLLSPEHEPDRRLRESLGELVALEGVRRYPSRAKSALLPWRTLIAAMEGRELASN